MNKETKDKDQDNTGLYVGAGLLLLLGIKFAFSQNSKSVYDAEPVEDAPIDPIKTPSPAIAIYVTKNLKVGSQGLEVTKLQGLMRITADGFFGPQTEAMLYRLKGVKQVSLDQYAKLPTINRAVLAVGTKVQSPLPTGTVVYDAIKKADNTYYSSLKEMKTIPFGQAIGTIRSASAQGNWYTVYYNDLWNGDFFTGKAIGFVRASEVESYK